MLLLLDTETKGFPRGPRYASASHKNLKDYETARLLQFSFIMADENYNQIKLYDAIIKVDSAEYFSEQAVRIHGIDYAKTQSEGYSIEDVMNNFYEALKQVSAIIAYNAEFDINIIKSELFRMDKKEFLKELAKKEIICAMKMSSAIMNLKMKNGQEKYPNLKEAYQFFVGKPLVNAHNSKYDTINLLTIMKNMQKQLPSNANNEASNCKKVVIKTSLDEYLFAVINNFNKKRNIPLLIRA